MDSLPVLLPDLLHRVLERTLVAHGDDNAGTLPCRQAWVTSPMPLLAPVVTMTCPAECPRTASPCG
jgi:hypothetical protein